MSSAVNQTVRYLYHSSWGSHLSLFYRSEDDLIKLLAEYFNQGIADNEYCIWVTVNDDIKKEARKAVNHMLPGISERTLNERMEFASANEWYLPRGLFDTESVLNRWQERLSYAINCGYTGMRVSGDLGWLDDQVWNQLLDYESKLSFSVPHQRLKVACSYPLQKLNQSRMRDVVLRHHRALSKSNGEWKSVITGAASVASSGIRISEAEIFSLPILYADKCNGCGICVTVCQPGIIVLGKDTVILKDNGNCDWCRLCEEVCPVQAIICAFSIVE